MLWLQVGQTNNNPYVIAWYYLPCVKQLKGKCKRVNQNLICNWYIYAPGAPRLLRADCGTENTNMSFIQPFLRRAHADCFAEMNSRYGKSVTNQVLLLYSYTTRLLR